MQHSGRPLLRGEYPGHNQTRGPHVLQQERLDQPDQAGEFKFSFVLYH